MLEDGTIASNDSIFYSDDDGTVWSTPERPVLNLNGCNLQCGADFGWYVDIGPRLSTWLIPVFLLLSNMEVSPLDKRRYLMILHLLGDPIDSLWALLSKLEAWSRCYHKAAEVVGTTDLVRIRNVATVLGGFEELVGFRDDPAEIYTGLKAMSKPTGRFDLLVARTAWQLADSRTDERLRTLLATTLYIYQIVAAFIATVGGGNTSPPGGRIGIAMFMTWIIPSILLSNAIGGFASRRTCYSIMETFVRDVTEGKDAWPTLRLISPTFRDSASVDNYFDNMAWSGAVYSYRPEKHIAFRSASRNRSPGLLLCLAAAPIFTSSIIASVILWNTPPLGINCRNILVFVMTGLVLLSALFTKNDVSRTGRRLPHATVLIVHGNDLGGLAGLESHAVE
ncbi:hypothetical protein EK21DRAFT_102357 [Setomelanomma holmii]|uniref:Uncharacterized protein n=1 Tax=Setomelanomma holmii TaxID=210430 RepID=A0A9P4LJI7_9PLEO|nr:hypothetical protein EK21DRAFT_102357 [Setomelanomma holmii]